jgi:hypothetical protein
VLGGTHGRFSPTLPSARHRLPLTGLADDVLKGLEERSRIAREDAVTMGVLNVRPVDDLGQEFLDCPSRPVRGSPAAATRLGSALLEPASTWL